MGPYSTKASPSVVGGDHGKEKEIIEYFKEQNHTAITSEKIWWLWRRASSFSCLLKSSFDREGGQGNTKKRGGINCRRVGKRQKKRAKRCAPRHNTNLFKKKAKNLVFGATSKR